ncbi:hypothetical protein J1614_008686 [Plenodomus biglobosus]|nr:hypothetical protein J1614_008686 [Plenodomus biglobosus]
MRRLEFSVKKIELLLLVIVGESRLVPGGFTLAGTSTGDRGSVGYSTRVRVNRRSTGGSAGVYWKILCHASSVAVGKGCGGLGLSGLLRSSLLSGLGANIGVGISQRSGSVGIATIAVGIATVAVGIATVAVGIATVAVGIATVTVGVGTVTVGVGTVTVGVGTVTVGVGTVTVGIATVTVGVSSRSSCQM